MNRPSLLHIVERLEGFVGKLPETIQKPILRELTPLKELFLQQRLPRFVFTGATRNSLPEIVETLFASAVSAETEGSLEKGRWQDLSLGDHGTISVLDARQNSAAIKAELNRQPADIIVLLIEEENAPSRKTDMQNFSACLEWNDKTGVTAKAIGIVWAGRKRGKKLKSNGEMDDESDSTSPLVLGASVGDRFLGTFGFGHPLDRSSTESSRLMSILAREVPNEARIEMIRISRDREAQKEVAQILVKSTAAVCTAIGTQPIPLADLPILTTLQLVMVSGIMYVSGRERSLRAATEFIAALGVNVGAGMLLREGARALLKFFPGWGNVICGMVAGAGTYALGRAATVFFLEGVSLKDARRVYLTSRKRPERPALETPKRPRKRAKPRK